MFTFRFCLLTFAAIWLWGCAPEPVLTAKAQPVSIKPAPKKIQTPEPDVQQAQPSSLSHAQQKAMYFEKVDGENKNEWACETQFPSKKLNLHTPDSVRDAIVNGHAKLSAELDDKLYNRLEKKYHISFEQMCEINGRGERENWPAPPIVD